MIHCRDAYEDTLNILRGYNQKYGTRLRGNIHFFAGNVAVAQRFFELGFTLSFTGVLTFASEYDEVVREAPLESIMAETDAPYATPVPYRGKRNEPLYVIEIIERIAQIRGISSDEARSALLGNTQRVFPLSL